MTSNGVTAASSVVSTTNVTNTSGIVVAPYCYALANFSTGVEFLKRTRLFLYRFCDEIWGLWRFWWTVSFHHCLRSHVPSYTTTYPSFTMTEMVLRLPFLNRISFITSAFSEILQICQYIITKWTCAYLITVLDFKEPWEQCFFQKKSKIIITFCNLWIWIIWNAVWNWLY